MKHWLDALTHAVPRSWNTGFKVWLIESGYEEVIHLQSAVLKSVFLLRDTKAKVLFFYFFSIVFGRLVNQFQNLVQILFLSSLFVRLYLKWYFSYVNRCISSFLAHLNSMIVFSSPSLNMRILLSLVCRDSLINRCCLMNKPQFFFFFFLVFFFWMAFNFSWRRSWALLLSTLRLMRTSY